MEQPYAASRGAPPARSIRLNLWHSRQRINWVVDSGASRHFSTVSLDFSSLTLNDKLGTVSGIDCKIEGSGRISFFVFDQKGKQIHMNLKDVLYVPSLSIRSGGSYLRLMIVRLAANA